MALLGIVAVHHHRNDTQLDNLGKYDFQTPEKKRLQLETFVDPQYFDGTCYRAANFRYLGLTRGMGFIRQGQSYTTSPKKIFVYPLADNFRQVLCSADMVGRAY